MPDAIAIEVKKLPHDRGLCAAMCYGSMTALVAISDLLRKQQSLFQSHPVARESCSRMRIVINTSLEAERILLKELIGD